LQQFFADYSPEILCLNETKTDLEKLDKKRLHGYIPNGYAQYWNCCSVKKGYSGTAMFTKVKPISVQFDFNNSDNDPVENLEGRSITAEFEKFILVVTYVPNAGEGLKRLDYRINTWDKNFHAYLKQLEKRGKPVILSGDLNVAHHEIDLYDTKGKEKIPGYTPQERNSFSKLLERGFIDTFRDLYPSKVQYSFWSARANLRVTNRGWRLDYFLISDFHQKNGVKVVDSLIHD